jgi:hypothetical protein
VASVLCVARVPHATDAADQHGASYSVGLFVAGLRGRGLGREITRLILSWAFGVLGVHRVELEVLTFNRRAINCYQPVPGRLEGPDPDGTVAIGVRGSAGRIGQRGLGVGLGHGGPVEHPPGAGGYQGRDPLGAPRPGPGIAARLWF